MIDISKVYTSNHCGQFKIVEYVNAQHVLVEFLSTGTRKTTQASNIKAGSIKDEYLPLVFGVGFIGKGRHKPSKKGRLTNKYQTWTGMLERCYCPKFQGRQPTYTGCTVISEWHDFQLFSEWFDDNYINGRHLDKDIKIKGNKVYSPVTCLFVTAKDNAVESQAKHYRFISPDGKLIEVYNLAEFCRNNGLANQNMSSVHSGKRLQHKRWTKSK